jgi:hypothetical protein
MVDSSSANTSASTVVLGTLATAGLVGLCRLSGDDRRDRRRVVVLAAHAFAAPCFAAVSIYVGTCGGPAVAAGAALVEETAEALSAVAQLSAS